MKINQTETFIEHDIIVDNIKVGTVELCPERNEIARLVTLEFESEMSGSPRADYLSEAYKKIIEDSPVWVEYACALGGVFLKPYISSSGICTDYVQADATAVSEFDSAGNITGAVFADRIIRNSGPPHRAVLVFNKFKKDAKIIGIGKPCAGTCRLLDSSKILSAETGKFLQDFAHLFGIFYFLNFIF